MRYAHHYPESLRDGVEILDRISTNLAIKRGYSKCCNPLTYLVAGAGFEPTTFGL